MEPAKIASFIRGLMQRSSKNEVEWIRLEAEKYGVKVKEVLVSLEVRPNNREFDEVDIVISFQDLSTGDLIVEYSDVDLRDHLEHSFRALQILYDEARMSVTGYKKKLDSALEVFTKDDPEHIPF